MEGAEDCDVPNVPEHPSKAAPEQQREIALEAEVLLGHVLGVARTGLLAHPNRPLSRAEARRYQALLRRRMGGEPVAYLVGHREFFGLEFVVDRRVLVPRPETELLVEQAIAEAQRIGRVQLHIADVGTGSGAIAISLAKHLPGAKLYGIDLSAGALAVAAANCWRHGVAGQVTLLHGDLLSPLPRAVEIIIANLPYVAPEDVANLPREVVGQEPRLALLAGEGGLGLNRRLLAQARPYLLPGGAIVLEIDPAQTQAIVAQAKVSFPGAAITVGKDYAGLDRFVLVRTRHGD